MDMFKDYVKEREGYDTIENEYGFIIYKQDEDFCFIKEMYIAPLHRQTHRGSELADRLAETVKANGCKRFYANVVPSTKTSTIAIKAILGYGFNVFSAGDDRITLVKELI